MKTWLQLKDVNLSLEANNSQYNLTYFFFLILHLLVALASEKKKESHAVIVPLTGNRYLGKLYLNKSVC